MSKIAPLFDASHSPFLPPWVVPARRLFTSHTQLDKCFPSPARLPVMKKGWEEVEEIEEQKGRCVFLRREDGKEIKFEQFEVLTKSCLVKGEIRILYRLEPLFDERPAHNSCIQPCKQDRPEDPTPKPTFEKTHPDPLLPSLHSSTPILPVPIHPRL